LAAGDHHRRLVAFGGRAGGGLDLHDIADTAAGKALADRASVTVAGVGDQHRRVKLPAGQLIQHVEGELPLGPVMDIGGQVRCVAPLDVVIPAGGEEQPPVQWAGCLLAGRVDRDARLAVGDLAERSAVLALHPTEWRPSLGKPVSSTTQTAGSITRHIRSARRRRTGRQSHGEAWMKWCSACLLVSGSRAAIGWIDLRRPSSSSPRR
jgi:hypothetical protein